MRAITTLLLSVLLLAVPGWAQEDAPAEGAVPQGIALAGAYQSGYLQVVAVSCFQLYISAGIIQSDLLNGVISPAIALDSLEYNSLMQSVCATTLEEIRSLTPAEDPAGLAELDRLISINTAEGELLRALQDFCTNTSDTTYAAVVDAQHNVEAALDDYTATNQLGFKQQPGEG